METSNSVTFSNIDIPVFSMEMAGFAFSGYRPYPLLKDFTVININLGDIRKQEIDENFSPSFIFCDNHFYHLAYELKCKVSFKDGTYIIECPSLNLSVWGPTKEEAVKSFNFGFHSLYENFVKESDGNLSTEAKKLKRKLKSLVS